MDNKTTNYEYKASWISCPLNNDITHPVDVFFVYPTVYFHPNKNKNHNMSVKSPIFRPLARFSSWWHNRPFAHSCNVFAPFYRQAGMEILNMPKDKFLKYSRIAYSDIREAFLFYMKHLNNGRPFILAGHSQGSEMLLGLLMREFSKNEYAKQFIAAYLIGFSVTRDDFIIHPHLKIAKSEDDLGCIITYNTSAKGLPLMRVVRKGAICVNPLNFKLTEEYASKEENLGSVFFTFGKRKLQKKHFTGAYVDKKQGVVIIDDDALYELMHIKIKFLNKLLMHRQSLHTLDIALFHNNIQKNIDVRIDSHFKKHGRHNNL